MVIELKPLKRAYSRSIILVAIFVCLNTYLSYGQIVNVDIEHAVRVLKNIDTDKSKLWAVSTLESAACNDSSAYAMNCLGLAYMAGLGVDTDTVKAVTWLESAGRYGYSDAYHNLGMMFKYSRGGVRQDFVRAYGYFSAGADSGSVSCMYDKGFMLYKGLGCGQNYREAVSYFCLASESQHSPSLYMLGLCYRNGYGVEKDSSIAYDYLSRSASLGYLDAREELGRINRETYLQDVYSDMPERQCQSIGLDGSGTVNDINLIEGCYQGHLVMYDWSGSMVLGEKPLAMNIERNGSEVHGMMVLGEDSVPFKAEISSDSRLVFKKGSLMLYERYTPKEKVKYRIDNMLFDVWSDKINGWLNLYSLKQKEPERPMYFELCRDGVTGNKSSDERYCTIAVSPNPFDCSFNASFEIKESADVQVWVFNVYGMLVWQKDLGRMEIGKHKVELSPDITHGKYIISVKVGGQTLRTIIIKEGGM